MRDASLDCRETLGQPQDAEWTIVAIMFRYSGAPNRQSRFNHKKKATLLKISLTHQRKSRGEETKCVDNMLWDSFLNNASNVVTYVLSGNFY